ncbi:MAG: V-type ATP synthase subunit K [Trueperaceae bacterium]|jgi:V/A-type H+-transporting ATPase subunit K|nr:V-type ATP synthase subunit K [Truepera sp.]HRQ10387.1 V-type ATP synthase subunit K [Trueperaceae bacterium]
MIKAVRVLSAISLFALFGAVAFAQSVSGPGLGAGLIALGAGLAIGLAAIAVGIAQAAIGSAGAGLLAERPEAFGQILIYLVIPETLIIFGFVIAFFLNNQIGG